MTLRFGTALFAVLLASAPAAAETLLVERVQQENHAAMPMRGMSMAQVQARFGAPLEKLPAAGGDTPRHPVINRWRYGGYIVYFERNRVIHSVIDGSLPTS